MDSGAASKDAFRSSPTQARSLLRKMGGRRGRSHIPHDWVNKKMTQLRRLSAPHKPLRISHLNWIGND
jgi:hypothetical protein